MVCAYGSASQVFQCWDWWNCLKPWRPWDLDHQVSYLVWSPLSDHRQTLILALGSLWLTGLRSTQSWGLLALIPKQNLWCDTLSDNGLGFLDPPVVSRPAASAPPGSRLEMQNLRPTLKDRTWTCFLTKSQGDSFAHFSLRSPGLDYLKCSCTTVLIHEVGEPFTPWSRVFQL